VFAFNPVEITIEETRVAIETEEDESVCEGFEERLD